MYIVKITIEVQNTLLTSNLRSQHDNASPTHINYHGGLSAVRLWTNSIQIVNCKIENQHHRWRAQRCAPLDMSSKNPAWGRKLWTLGSNNMHGTTRYGPWGPILMNQCKTIDFERSIIEHFSKMLCCPKFSEGNTNKTPLTIKEYACVPEKNKILPPLTLYPP